ncbi:MAG: hypothetical protein A2W91_16050 [Bacteroidetes bacterium GWF2_38_335]|nr:MAG: hypothetical protein A2W91_16050 [Bacteroidetes bacterium GWF2_38_335]OFY81202.1 MAG: hypothetical protein A2281_07025 [Bacteroidetes bacterium RIFOXYA12_FULL_38_20]HBS85318.1 hypothetical protein [Bacteroidales bacterium]
MKKSLLIILMLISCAVFSQYNFVTNNGQTLFTSSATFELGDYVPGEIYTLTFCADDPNCSQMVITIDHVMLYDTTQVIIFDGPDVYSPILTDFIYDGEVFTASPENSSGCLTISFYCVSLWAEISGTVGCQFLCSTPGVNITGIPELIPGTAYTINSCEPGEIELHAQGEYTGALYPQSDELSTFVWYYNGDSIGTGQTFTFNASAVTEGIIQVAIFDQYFCSAENDTVLLIDYLDNQDEVIFPSPFTTYVLGDTVHLFSYSSTDALVLMDCETPMPIPDGSGAIYTYPISTDCFLPGQTLESIDQIRGICANMEHSFIGDLTIEITCSANIYTGGTATVILEDQHGGGTYMGVPIDDSGGSGPGVGWDYCWTTAMYADYPMDMGDMAGSVSTLPSGSYLTSEPLNPLVGCLLNGDWILTITDNWAIDDGHIFCWNVFFDPELYLFYPATDPEYTSTDWIGENILSETENTATALPLETGSFEYVHHVTSLSGCEYEYSTIIHVIDEPSYITGNIFCDENLNCVFDAEEMAWYGRIIEVTPGPYYGSVGVTGFYDIMVPEGEYTVELIPHVDDSIVCTGSYFYDVSTMAFDTAQNIDFGILNKSFADLKVYLGSGFARVGNYLQYSFYIENSGSYPVVNATLSFAYDPVLLLVYSSTSFADYFSDSLSIVFDVLDPHSFQTVYIGFNLPDDATLIGSELNAEATIGFSGTDLNISNNTSTRTQLIYGSYDPNFKEVFPAGIGETGDIYLEDSLLHYVVHFQNTGNDTAFLVQIVDPLSQNLEITSIIPGAASHPYIWDLNEYGEVIFTFEDINLPDSATNEPASHGFVSYEINLANDANIGEVIENTAYIYFDNNLPIVTNTTINTIIDHFVSVEDIQFVEVNVYPNPTIDNLNINSDPDCDNQVYNLSGQLVLQEKGNKIDVRGLEKGTYVLKVLKNNQVVATVKFIKQE